MDEHLDFFNHDDCHFFEHLSTSDINDEDDECEEEASPPKLDTYYANPSEVPKNKRAQALNSIAEETIQRRGIKVMGSNLFFVYDEENGCFQETPDLSVLLFDVLEDRIENLTTKELKEIQNLIAVRSYIHIEEDAFNKDADIINFKSGVLDWRTMELYNQGPKLLFNYYIDSPLIIEEEADIKTPIFDQFCETSLQNDSLKIQFILEMIGYCISDSNAAKCAFFLVGEANSGKSIILNFITKLVGERLVANIPLHRLSEKFPRAELVGKKLNVAGELSGRMLSDISVYKGLTGGDRLEAERKGSAVFFFKPRAKLIFSGNCFPQVKENDVTNAFINRMGLLMFNCSIEPEKQDKQLLSKLWDERGSIVMKSLYALQRLAERNFAFELPEDSKEYIKHYKANQNSVISFVSDCCEFDERTVISNTKLLASYKSYCSENGLETIGRTNFYEIICSFSNVTKKRCRIGSKNLQCCCGLRVKNEE